MVTKRMLSPSLYLGGPLDALVRDIVPPGKFDSLKVPLLVSTVDLERGSQMIWGLPGLQDVEVADAVYASCALPGFFPPRVIEGRTCVDGGVMDNLPNAIAVRGMDAVIGVDVGSSSVSTARRIKDKGFAAIYMRAAQTMMRSLQVSQLATWAGPPLLLVRPPVWHYNWFSFAATRRMLDAGYAAAHDALDRAGDALSSAGGVYPRRTIEHLGGPREVHRLHALRHARAGPDGDGRRGKGARAGIAARMVARGRRLHPPVPHRRDSGGRDSKGTSGR